MAERITSRTRLAAVLGWPAKHSLSPALHNTAFETVGFDAVLLAFDVAPKHLAHAVAGLKNLGAIGASVTVPHKEAAATLCDELAPTAQRVRAVNCLVFADDRIVGHNTDADGFIDSLAEVDLHPKNKEAVILGAGGAARAVHSGLVDAAANVRVVARTPGNVDWIECSPWSDASFQTLLPTCDLLIDCTSVGLAASNETQQNLPPPLELLPANATVATLIYHRSTALLDRAQALGLATVTGAGMLVHQGARAFKLWTGIDAPVAVMRRQLAAAIAQAE